MNNKYYTPSIEEFYVGFEIYNNDKSIIVDEQFYYDYLIQETYYGERDIKNMPIRVKYLDKEDIESLGFVHIGKSIDDWFEIEGDFKIGNWTSYKVILHYGYDDNRLFIETIDRAEEYKLFEGTIKNKSELKKLLTQLNIT